MRGASWWVRSAVGMVGLTVAADNALTESRDARFRSLAAVAAAPDHEGSANTEVHAEVLGRAHGRRCLRCAGRASGHLTTEATGESSCGPRTAREGRRVALAWSVQRRLRAQSRHAGLPRLAELGPRCELRLVRAGRRAAHRPLRPGRVRRGT